MEIVGETIYTCGMGATMEGINIKDSLHPFIEGVYRVCSSNRRTTVRPEEIGDQLGLVAGQSQKIVEQLIDHDLIRQMTKNGDVSITFKGIRSLEK